MLGYPGAGKTTAAKIIKDLTDAQYLSSDELRRSMFKVSRFDQPEHDTLYQALDNKLIDYLGVGTAVIYDANLNRYIHREQKYNLAKKYGYKTTLIWVKAPKEVAKKRRIEDVRHHHLVPPHETPEQMFERTSAVFEAPRPHETFIELDGTKITRDHVKKVLSDANVL